MHVSDCVSKSVSMALFCYEKGNHLAFHRQSPLPAISCVVFGYGKSGMSDLQLLRVLHNPYRRALLGTTVCTLRLTTRKNVAPPRAFKSVTGAAAGYIAPFIAVLAEELPVILRLFLRILYDAIYLTHGFIKNETLGVSPSYKTY